MNYDALFPMAFKFWAYIMLCQQENNSYLILTISFLNDYVDSSPARLLDITFVKGWFNVLIRKLKLLAIFGRYPYLNLKLNRKFYQCEINYYQNFLPKVAKEIIHGAITVAHQNTA